MSGLSNIDTPADWERDWNRQQAAASMMAKPPLWHESNAEALDRVRGELYADEHAYLSADEDLAFGHSPPQAPSPLAQICRQGDLNPPPAQGYMDQPSPFSLDSPPTETMFMSLYPSGNGTISFHNQHNEMESIRNVNVSLVSQRCPVIGLAFEDSRSGPQLYLELLTPKTAIPFLRFLYTGTYALSGGPGAGVDIYDDVPTSVLSHCLLYRLGDVYDLPLLKTQAYVNVLRQCEFGCSSPDKPIDLCAAIQYIYKELREHANLIDALVQYCVSCFLTHNLAIDPEFKQLAYELRVFHQDLCQAVMGRDIENATAMAIIQMPFRAVAPPAFTSDEDVDVIWQFHGDHEIPDAVKPRKIQQGAIDDHKMAELPIRERKQSLKTDHTQPSTDHEPYPLGQKHAVPSSSNPVSPVVGGIAHLLKAENTEKLVEAEYEVIGRSLDSDRAADSDSESAGFVKIEQEDEDDVEDAIMEEIWSQLDRTQQDDKKDGNPKGFTLSGESDSESDWMML